MEKVKIQTEKAEYEFNAVKTLMSEREIDIYLTEQKNVVISHVRKGYDNSNRPPEVLVVTNEDVNQMRARIEKRKQGIFAIFHSDETVANWFVNLVNEKYNYAMSDTSRTIVINILCEVFDERSHKYHKVA